MEDAGVAYEETKEKYEDYIAQFPKLQEELGITQDENGKWITTLSEAGDEAEKTGKKASDANDDISDSSEKMGDTVRKAVSTYIEETQKLANADPSDIIRDQLAAAAAEVQSFQDTIKGNLSSFSLFGDRSSLIDAYTSTNRDEMTLNMSWQLKAMQDYTKELDTLQKRGISTDFIDYLTSQGQAGLNYVHSLALASDAELQQFQEAFTEYNGYITGANDNVKKLLTDYAQGISAGIADGYDSWHQFGIETTAGLFDAIDEATAAIKNGSISGDITNALQVVLQNKADQIETEKEAQKRAHSIQVNEATKTRDVERRAANDDLRVTVDVTTQNIIDGKVFSENTDRRAKVKRQITGRR